MPASDPLTSMKHIRFGKPCPELLEALKTFPGIKAIVLHKRGKKEEHPHYHTFWSGEATTCMTLKAKLIKHSSWIAGHPERKSNGFWRCKAHDSWDKWANYVMGNPSAEVLLDNPDTPLPPVAVMPIVVGTSAERVPLVVLKTPNKRDPQRVQFVRYLTNKGWELEKVKSWNMYELLDEIVEELTEWSENAFTTPNGAVIVQHALYHFADEVAKNVLKQKNKDAIRKSIRLFSTP